MDSATIESLASFVPKGRERDFLRRVFGSGPKSYDDRLSAVGFNGMENVLDAGAGMGQWSLRLAQTNFRVTALEPAELRIGIVKQAAELLDIDNVQCVRGTLNDLPFPDASFDGVFAYSVLYLTRWKDSLAECVRVLKPGGRLYVNANGVGWLLRLLLKGGKSSEDFSPRMHALQSMIKNVSNGLLCPKADWALSPSRLVGRLERLGVKDICYGGDGELTYNNAVSGRPFFPSRFVGCWSTFEIMGTK